MRGVSASVAIWHLHRTSRGVQRWQVRFDDQVVSRHVTRKAARRALNAEVYPWIYALPIADPVVVYS